MDEKPVVITEPKSDVPTRSHPRHFHIFWPLLLIAVGVFLFLNTTHMIAGDTIDTLLKLWPLLLVIGGIEGFINRGGFVWSVLLSGLGVLFLLSNFNYIHVSVWNIAFRLWPVLIIALGLDLLIGRRRGWISWVVGILVGLAMVAGIYWFAMSYAGGSPQRTEAITMPLAGAKNASGNISMAAGTLMISGGAQDKNILEGDIDLRKNEGFSQNSSVTADTGTFSLRVQDSHSYYPFDTSNYSWDIKLIETVPMKLSVELAAGEIVADLSKLDLTNFDIKIAAGTMKITLPNDGTYHGVIEGAASAVTIYIPKDARICVNSSSAVSFLNVPAGFDRKEFCGDSDASEIDVQNAVGIVDIKYIP